MQSVTLLIEIFSRTKSTKPTNRTLIKGTLSSRPKGTNTAETLDYHITPEADAASFDVLCL
jgi:hypothetical protein